MPTYHEIASKLKEENFVFAKIDCLKNEKIETIYEIEAFPTLMLIKGEERITFSGKRNFEEIKQWLEENTWPEFIKLNNKKELDNFTINRLCMVYFGNNDSTKNEFIKAERKFETMPLGLVTDEALIKSEAPTDEKDPNKEYKNFINLYKTFGEKKNTLKDSLTSENIYKFVYINSYPDVIEFSDETAPIIFAKKQPALVIFSLKITADYERHFNFLKELRPKVDANIRLFICDISKSTMAMQLAQYCGVTLLNLPKVFIIQAESETPKKYEMNVEIN
jgi:protein disulfide-isomerase A1